MQYNADTLSTKVLELKDRLTKDDIDICIVQETKMTQGTKLPSFDGYVPLRADRKLVNAGGGLLILLRDTLVIEKLDAIAIEATETISVKVRLGKRDWL